MANHKSAIKRIRQEKKRALHNKYYAKTMRNAVRKLRAITDKKRLWIVSHGAEDAGQID